jgi:glycosyltransferase involved in cell wall biosynthesis
MKILWLTWKDKKNPSAGGAEVVNEELGKRLAADGHEVIFLVAGFGNAPKEEVVDGYKVIRVGSRWSVYWEAFKYYKKNLVGWADKVIDEVNTIPFMAKFYVKEPNILFVHQLCREIWFYEMFFPLSLIGYLIEPIYLWLLSDRKVITVSESTKKDLMRFGFKAENIGIISEGIEIESVTDLSLVKKEENPTIISHGTIRSMKRTHHIVKAFELAKKQIPNLKLWVSGGAEGRYGKKVIEMMKNSPYASDITYFGRVSKEQKIDLLRRAHLFCATSVKEGWCLVVTEANSQGTPAVVYDVDGLRDAVINNTTGVVCKINNPAGLSQKIVGLLSGNSCFGFQQACLETAKTVSFLNSHKQFLNYIYE